jgi:polysaccharide export outer membrane protein
VIDLFFASLLAAGQSSITAPPATAQACRPALTSPVSPAPVAEVGRSPAAAAAGARGSLLEEAEPAYTIGIDDVLTIHFWREESMSGDVVVRSDGKISMPLISEIDAAGLTPLELCSRITEAAAQFIQNPTVSVLVKQINSRKIYVTGMVGKGGSYPITGPMTVMQLISIAGGLHEYADSENILVLRNEGGKQISFKVNFKDLSRGKNLGQNIYLKPGDTVIVR